MPTPFKYYIMDPTTLAMLSNVMQTQSANSGNALNFAMQMLTNWSNSRNVDKTNAANRQLAEMANKWSIEQWNRENAYNTPAAQMQRFRDAGLNPALMYGQENLAAASPAVTSAAGDMRSSQMLSPQVDPYVGIQSQLAESQRKKTDAETKVMLEKLPKEMRILSETAENISSNTSKTYHEIEVLIENKNYVHEKARGAMLENQYLSRTLDERVDIVKQEKRIKTAEADYIRRNMQAQVRNLEKMYDVLISQENMNNAQRDQLKAYEHQIMYHANKEIDAMTRYYDKQSGFVATKTVLAPIDSFTGLIHEGVNAYATFTTKGKVPSLPSWNGNYNM